MCWGSMGSVGSVQPGSAAEGAGRAPWARVKRGLAAVHERITRLPPNVPEKYRDVYAMTHYTYWCGLVLHVVFLGLFARLGLTGLAIFNCASILVYAGNLVISRRGRLHAALLIGGLEVALHQGYATLVLGLDAGFHFYLLILSFATLLYTHLSVSRRVFMAILPVVDYVVIYVHCVYHPPSVELAPGVLAWMGAGNLLVFSAILLGICFYFVNTAMKARIAAENLARAKSLFLANMSHELRTPLNAILGFTHILERSPALDAQDRRNLATIDRSGEHLLELINHVLDMSKLEDGKLALAENPVELRGFLGDLERMFQPAAARRRLEFVVKAGAELPGAVLADELKLRQVLINLLNNALKFTEAGRVELVVGAERPGGGERWRLRFAVKDTGPGIAAEERAQLFQLFTQTEAGRRSGGGTGLGLALSQSLVRLMGGQIEVESVVGRGSTFAFELVVRETSAPAARVEKRARGLAPGQRAMRLLVVDDNADNREVLGQFFQRLGFGVETAADGEEGVRRWRENPPDLTWMDLQMPGIDGYEAMRRIKALGAEAGRAAPVVTITASALPGERERALTRGCDDFVTKPFREAEIVRVLERILGARFVYEDETAGGGSGAAAGGLAKAAEFAWAERLGALGAEERGALRAAVEALDLDAAGRAAEAFEAREPELAREVRALLQDYRFDTLAEHLAK